MILILLRYTVPFAEIEKYLQAHREFLDYYYKQGLLVLSGPMIPRTGGVIIAATQDLAAVKAIFEQDPYALAELATYDFIAFTPVKHCQALADIVLQSEGKLC